MLRFLAGLVFAGISLGLMGCGGGETPEPEPETCTQTIYLGHQEEYIDKADACPDDPCHCEAIDDVEEKLFAMDCDETTSPTLGGVIAYAAALDLNRKTYNCGFDSSGCSYNTMLKVYDDFYEKNAACGEVACKCAVIDEGISNFTALGCTETTMPTSDVIAQQIGHFNDMKPSTGCLDNGNCAFADMDAAVQQNAAEKEACDGADEENTTKNETEQCFCDSARNFTAALGAFTGCSPGLEAHFAATRTQAQSAEEEACSVPGVEDVSGESSYADMQTDAVGVRDQSEEAGPSTIAWIMAAGAMAVMGVVGAKTFASSATPLASDQELALAES